jgi:enamine deaminase RidA (YjgF/YER057c/UK114 family)
MSRRLISSGSTFEKSIGYSRAVVDGNWIFVSGTTGFDYSNMTIQDDVVAQCEQALKNIGSALKQAGAGFKDVVRVHYLMTNGTDFERCWPAMGAAFGEVRPAATMMVVGLADPRIEDRDRSDCPQGQQGAQQGCGQGQGRAAVQEQSQGGTPQEMR